MTDFVHPGELFERYRVVRPLGRGGMAQVVLVRHTELDTLHALKVLTVTGPSLGDRMRDEGRLQAKLRHPNVVSVTDVLTVKGMPALVMEYVDGPDLGKWITQVQPDPELAERMFRGIVAGVAAAHEAGHVHRDLKPGNVLVATGADGEPVPKVTDFGLVKALVALESGDGRTRTGLPLGTPQYMAPEQMRDASKVDRRADVFSLGAILYELVAHTRAHPGEDIVDIFTRVSRRERKALPARVPERLRIVIDRCLEPDPTARPGTCAEVLALLDGDGAVARAEPRRRSQGGGFAQIGIPAVAVSAATVSLLVVLGVSTVVAFLVFRAREPGCPTRPGVIGYVQGPWVFDKPPGSTWLVKSELAVGPIPEAPDQRTKPVCVLVPGAQVRIVDPPVRRHDIEWVPIHGDHVAYGPVDAPVGQGEGEGMVGDRCTGADGERIGWLFTRPEGISVPKVGGRWKLNYPRAVFPDRSTEGTPTCALRTGTWVDIVEEPVKSGFREWWIPVTAGRFDEP